MYVTRGYWLHVGNICTYVHDNVAVLVCMYARTYVAMALKFGHGELDMESLTSIYIASW